MPNPTRVIVFNTTDAPAAPAIPLQTNSHLMDIVTAVDGVIQPTPGPSAAGVPVVLNPAGVIDPSLINAGSKNTVDTGGVTSGQLVGIYVPTSGPYIGQLTIQPATANPTGVGETAPAPPSGYPLAAAGFVSASGLAGTTATVSFYGTFNYNDPLSEFSASSIGMQVYLADSGDGSHGVGAITLTLPSAPGTLKQAVGIVVAYNSGVVTCEFVPSFPGSIPVTFGNVLAGTNTGQALVVGTGSTLSFSGSGTINANQITGDPVNTSGRTSGQALIWSGTAWAPATVSAAPGGSNGQLQFNNSGSFGGASNSSVGGTGAVVLGNVNDPSPVSTTAFTVSASGGIAISAQDWYSSNEGFIVANMQTSGLLNVQGINIQSSISIGAVPPLVVHGGNAGSPDIADFITAVGGTPSNVKTVWIDYNGNLNLGGGGSGGIKDSTGSLGTSGQALTTTGTQVLWASADTSVNMRSQRFSAGAVAAGTFAGPFSITFSPAYADNNYTAEISVELDTDAGFAPVVTGGFTKQAAGAGINVTVMNNDSSSHNVTIHVIARHD